MPKPWLARFATRSGRLTPLRGRAVGVFVTRHDSSTAPSDGPAISQPTHGGCSPSASQNHLHSGRLRSSSRCPSNGHRSGQRSNQRGSVDKTNAATPPSPEARTSPAKRRAFARRPARRCTPRSYAGVLPIRAHDGQVWVDRYRKLGEAGMTDDGADAVTSWKVYPPGASGTPPSGRPR